MTGLADTPSAPTKSAGMPWALSDFTNFMPDFLLRESMAKSPYGAGFFPPVAVPSISFMVRATNSASEFSSEHALTCTFSPSALAEKSCFCCRSSIFDTMLSAKLTMFFVLR